MKNLKNFLLGLVLVPCAILFAACGKHDNSVLFKSNFVDGNNGLFSVYGSVTDNEGTITLNKAEDADRGPSTYFGEQDKCFDWVEGGYTVSIKLKIDSESIEVGQGFNWSVALNNKNEVPSFITERSMYFRNYEDGIKVGYVFNGSSDALNQEATSNENAVALENGWYSMEFKFYEGENSQIKLEMKLKNNFGKTVFAVADAPLQDNTETVVTTENVGGLRYAWVSWMSASTLEVGEVKIVKN